MQFSLQPCTFIVSNKFHASLVKVAGGELTRNEGGTKGMDHRITVGLGSKSLFFFRLCRLRWHKIRGSEEDSSLSDHSHARGLGSKSISKCLEASIGVEISWVDVEIDSSSLQSHSSPKTSLVLSLLQDSTPKIDEDEASVDAIVRYQQITQSRVCETLYIYTCVHAHAHKEIRGCAL